jgi:hypothetical protein
MQSDIVERLKAAQASNGGSAVWADDDACEEAADLITALRDRVAKLEGERQWRPIETAPREGVLFDVWVPSYAEPGKGYRVADLWIDASGTMFRSRDPQPVKLAHPPTHWMPLPDSPPATDGV